MPKDYKDFLKRFKASGLTQKAFAEQHGLSPSMVSYYLRRGREISGVSKESGDFIPLEVTSYSGGVIEITTPSGLTIKVPL